MKVDIPVRDFETLRVEFVKDCLVPEVVVKPEVHDSLSLEREEEQLVEELHPIIEIIKKEEQHGEVEGLQAVEKIASVIEAHPDLI